MPTNATCCGYHLHNPCDIEIANEISCCCYAPTKAFAKRRIGSHVHVMCMFKKSKIASDNVPCSLQDRDMLRAGVGKAGDPAAPRQSKKQITQQLQQRRLLESNECTETVPHASEQLLAVSQQGHVDGMRGKAQLLEDLWLDLTRTREVLSAQIHPPKLDCGSS